MATPKYNTYVGMRYVPIFDGEWDRTKTYEPLTIVSNQGNSYTSRTFVPTGVDINNTEYWALTGNYNAQVEYYRQETARVKELIESCVKTFTNVDQLINAEDVTIDNVCCTLGYYTINDGGGATYRIVDSQPVGYYIELDNGLYAEIVNSITVTPEMFGAYGDGSHDDTTAWQFAVDTGTNIIAMHDRYKCGTINVTRNVNIDCNNAEFANTANVLFNFTGSVVTTLENELNYAKNSGYIISDSNYSNYSGTALLKGTNNFEKSRDYYTGGFVCTFFEGSITETYPIDVTNVSIDIIKPITFTLSNVGEINHANPGSNVTTIQIKYGYECVVRDCNIDDNGSYSVLCFDTCLACHVDNVCIQQRFANAQMLYSYLIALLNSSYCTVENSYLYNKDWHCVSTGDKYLCYKNFINNTKMYSEMQFGYLDHENTLGTVVTNCSASGICVSGLGTVKDCIITSNLNTYKNCIVRLNAMSDKSLASYTVKNVRLLPPANANGTYVGIWIAASPQTTGNTYYVNKVDIDNVKCLVDLFASIRFSFTNDSNYTIGDINIKNVNMNIVLGKLTNDPIDITNYKLTVSECVEKCNNEYLTIGASGYSFNELNVFNCKLRDFVGTFANVVLNNFFASSMITSTITGSLRGCGIQSTIADSVLAAVPELTLSDMKKSAIITYFNVGKSNNANKYYQKWVGAEMVATQITG